MDIFQSMPSLHGACADTCWAERRRRKLARTVCADDDECQRGRWLRVSRVQSAGDLDDQSMRVSALMRRSNGWTMGVRGAKGVA